MLHRHDRHVLKRASQSTRATRHGGRARTRNGTPTQRSRHTVERPAAKEQEDAAPAPQTEAASPGAFHADLHVRAAFHRYRPERLLVADMNAAPRVRFRVSKTTLGDVELLDLSEAGLGLGPLPELALQRGSLLEDLRVEHGGTLLWSGVAMVVHAGKTRLGVRLLGTGLDLDELVFRDELVDRELGQALLRETEFERKLPAEWRAHVASLANVWLEVRRSLDAHEERDTQGRWREQEACRRLCEAMHARAWPATERLMVELERLSAEFDPLQVELGGAYAQRSLAPELMACEFMYRAYAKPHGYAGDYRMMELGQSEQLVGDSLFARYLQYWVQETSLGHAIRSRGDVAVRAARELVATERPVRILSLACGPAIELRTLLRELDRLGPDQHVELVLLDQDERALQSCMRELDRVLEQRDDLDRVSVHCLHFSLRQVLAPKRGAERAVVEEVLSGMDLIYSMGLFDYLVQSTATKTARKLFELLRPGGRLLIGNLCRVPDSSWIMEYGLAWPLIYRDRDAMVDMGRLIDATHGRIDVLRDASGCCLFLDARHAGK